jgi:methylenetetrahydrofolate dehydrogenase (NADP+)/methenyltetrahydrofolate cyclohydrolase
LPPHINGSKIIEEIDPKKDVDGFHPVNVGNLSYGKDSLVPCTPLGSYLLIKNIQKNLTGLEALIIGRSNLNGKPMAQLLLKEDCTVTIGHSKTKNLKELCQKADIVVAAVGRANLVKGDWVKEGAIVIDVGINREEDKTEKKGYKIVGDVEFDSVVKKARAITPVPGGVGPMTIACLLNNTLKAFKNIN